MSARPVGALSAGLHKPAHLLRTHAATGLSWAPQAVAVALMSEGFRPWLAMVTGNGGAEEWTKVTSNRPSRRFMWLFYMYVYAVGGLTWLYSRLLAEPV